MRADAPRRGVRDHGVDRERIREPAAFNRDVWQRYGVDRWREIKAEYNVGQVLVPSDWALALPIAAQSRRYPLYDIP